MERLAASEESVKQHPTRPRRRLTESGTKLILVVVAACCSGVLLFLPRPVAPTETPSLMLDRHAMEAVREADRRAAKELSSGPSIERLQALFARYGKAEAGPGEPRAAFDERMANIRRTLRDIRHKHGRSTIAALRASAVERLGTALDGDMAPDAREALLGSFPRMLERYDLVRDGKRDSPRFVTRTLFKARWNAIAQIRLTAGFEPVELKAYWGWLALHAPDAPMKRRLAALQRYAQAGGEHATEARGVLAYRQGRYSIAAKWLGRAHHETGALRLRNHQLAATAEAAARPTSPSGQ